MSGGKIVLVPATGHEPLGLALAGASSMARRGYGETRGPGKTGNSVAGDTASTPVNEGGAGRFLDPGSIPGRSTKERS